MANRPAPALALREGDRAELERLSRSWSVRAGLAQRARIVVLAADGVGNTEIAERVGVARQTVLTWRARGNYERMQVSIESHTRWYSGTGDTTLMDVWGMMTHEFGHATSFSNHFGAAGDCEYDSVHQTMCPYIRTGMEEWRTLGTHDVHTFNDQW